MSSTTQAQKAENEYDDLFVAELGETETARLSEIEGQWKRPLYSKPDPRYAAAWEAITDQIGRKSQIALYKASLGL